MTLPASGSISLSQVNTELGRSSTATISLGESAVRTLFGVASGQISLSQGYGKANQFAFTISSSQTNANLRTLAINAGWNQTTKVVATIANGVYISSNSVGTPALTVNGSFPGGVELINNGFIVGMGGGGGAGGTAPVYDSQFTGGPGGAGSGGGIALSAQIAISVNNAGTIAGGGGGGGGGGGEAYQYGVGGGGGGGGRSSPAASSAGGARGYNTEAGPTNTYYVGVDGGTGSYLAAGSGGAGKVLGNDRGGNGGNGGGWGSAGSAGAAGSSPSGYAPTHGAGGAAGASGAAVIGNMNITWVATGTRLGGIA